MGLSRIYPRTLQNRPCDGGCGKWSEGEAWKVGGMLGTGVPGKSEFDTQARTGNKKRTVRPVTGEGGNSVPSRGDTVCQGPEAGRSSEALSKDQCG